MRDEVLEFLRQNQGGFVSEQDMSEACHVSRTAIWKHIKALRQKGYKIESYTKRGYRLLEEPDLLSPLAMKQILNTDIFGKRYVYMDTTESTNLEARRLAQQGAEEGTVVVTEEQAAGRGRLSRGWYSPFGKGLWFSLILRPDFPPAEAPKCTLMAAVALTKAFHKMGLADAGIKWPNDIVLNRKKVCGILTEMNMEIDSIAYVVVGVGINVNRMEFREDIAETATSLKKESGHSIERAELLSEILSSFFRDYKLFLEKQDLSPFLESYNQKLVNVGREVKIIKKGEEIIRTAIGINDRGELIVQDAEGNTEHIFSGEVSVRGIYGYV